MFNIEMDNQFVDREKIERANDLLFEMWFEEELVRKMVKDTVNVQRFKSIINTARENDAIVPLIGLGCQPMNTVLDGLGGSVSMVPSIDNCGNDRISRWVNGFASFQKALKSWGAESALFLSLSDVQLLAQLIDDPRNADLVDPNVMLKNNIFIVNLINQIGGKADSFTHSETLMNALKIHSFDELIRRILPKWNGERLTHTGLDCDIEPLPMSLFEMDPAVLPESILTTSDLDLLVWVNMTSDLAVVDDQLLQASLKQNRPGTPLISPCANAGNWNAAADPSTVFLAKNAFILEKLGVVARDGKSNQRILDQIMNTFKDSDLSGFLSTLGIDIVAASTPQRVQAIRIIEKILFGTETFDVAEADEQIFCEEKIKQVLVRATGEQGNHVSALIKQGVVAINGQVVTDFSVIPQPGDLITIGRKSKFRLV